MFNQSQFPFQENKPGNQTIAKVMLTETYSETSQNSKTELFVKTVNG